MLSSAGFGNDARLAHALGKHGLADGVVDFVCAGVVEVFALQEDLRAAHLAAHAGCVVHGGWATHKVRQFGLEFGDELRVVLVLGVSVFELVDGVRQGFTDKTTAVDAEMAFKVWLLVIEHGDGLGWGRGRSVFAVVNTAKAVEANPMNTLRGEDVVRGAHRLDKLLHFGGIFQALA